MFVFSEKVKKTMDNKGMSLTDLGNKVGVHSSALSRLFANKTKSISFRLLYNICKELNLELNEVLVDNTTMQSNEQSLNDVVDNIRNLSKELEEEIQLLTFLKNNMPNKNDIYVIKNNDEKHLYIAESEGEY